MDMPIEPKETALLVVDMQNGFCDPRGAMARAGLNYQQQNLIIPAVKELVRACRGAGIRVLWSVQKHYPEDVTRKNTGSHRIWPSWVSIHASRTPGMPNWSLNSSMTSRRRTTYSKSTAPPASTIRLSKSS